MSIALLDKLHESGDLRELVTSGIMNPNVLEWRKMYHAVQQRTSSGRGKNKAVKDISKVFNISERTIFRVLKKLEPKN